MKFLSVFQKLARIWFYLVLILVSALFITGGVLFMRSPKETFVPVNVKIVEITEDGIGPDDVNYHVFVDYEVEGVRYEHKELGSYSSSMKVGKVIEAEYSLENPAHIQGKGAEVIPYVVMAVGVVCLLIALIGIVRTARRKTPLEEATAFSAGNFSAGTDLPPDGEMKNYVYHFAGRMNQGFVLEDEAKNVVFEANKTKAGFLFKPAEYEFYNRLTGRREMKKVGAVISSSVRFGEGSSLVGIPTDSHFKLDGRNNWEYFTERGYVFDYGIEGFGVKYGLCRGGAPVARLETAGVAAFKEKYENNPLAKIPASGVYRVQCREEDIDVVCLFCFCVSRALH